MKFSIVALVIFLGMQALVAKAEFREFTDAKGRTITAKLISYNAMQEKVTIKLKGKGNKTVPIGIFSETDQQYIVSWNKYQDFLSDKALRFKFNRNKIKNADLYRSSGWWEEKFYDCNFSVEIDNRSTVNFNNVELEYVVFYTQEHFIKRSSDKEERHGTLYSRKTINLPARSTKEIETDKILMSYDKTGGSSYGRPNIEGEMHGIMLKLSLKTDSGETISRQIKFPEKLNHIWTPRTKDVQRHP